MRAIQVLLGPLSSIFEACRLTVAEAGGLLGALPSQSKPESAHTGDSARLLSAYSRRDAGKGAALRRLRASPRTRGDKGQSAALRTS